MRTERVLYPVRLEVNGGIREVQARGSELLLYTLRERLGLTGCKPGCENGDCGACTVLIGDLPMKSCLMLTVEADGRTISTAEGMADTPTHRAFARRQAFQCGYCTPGFVANSEGLRRRHPQADTETIRRWLESNICRCTSYEEIHEAITDLFGGGNAP